MKTLQTTLLLILIAFNIAAQPENNILDQQIIKENYDLPWPIWVFDHWVWEDESTMESALTLVNDYKARNIPVSAIIIDSPWETGYNTFEWDTSLFPNAQLMIDSFHNMNVKVLMWITSMINTDVQPLYDYAANEGYFMKTSSSSQGPAVLNWWKGDGSLVDFFNPDAVDWWKGLMDQMHDYGIDGWKCDGTDFSALQAGWSPGKGSQVPRLEYSHAYYRLHFEYTREVLGDDRVITARPIDNYGIADIGGETVAFAPTDISYCAWVGDQDGTFEGLVYALNNMYHSSEMGYLSHGSDIGGYRTDNNYNNGRSKQLFIRWAQLGAFSGLMENGGGGEHRPWLFDQETLDIYRKLVHLRSKLKYYLMAHSETYFTNEWPLMNFFNKTDYSYMLGPDIFVAPFLEQGTSITVNFPDNDDWVYYYDTTKIYSGGTQENLSIPYEEYPVFFRKDSNPLSINEKSSEINVHVFPNPTKNIVTVRIDENTFLENIQVELIDLEGKVLYLDRVNSNSFQIDISGFSKGVYLCRLTHNGQVVVKKVMRN